MATQGGTVSEEDILTIVNGSPEDCIGVMNNFILHNEKNKSFPDLSLDMKKSLYEGIFTRLSSPTTSPALMNLLLGSLRILSRELSTLDLALTEDHIQTILKVSRLKESTGFENCGDSETLGALKVIFNITFQSAMMRSKFVSNGFLEYLVASVESFPQISSWEIKYFTMRILFIMTALLSESGSRIRDELKGLSSIIEHLEIYALQTEPFDDGTVDLICEMLKVVYNLMHDFVPNSDEEQQVDHFHATTKLVKTFLLHDLQSEEKRDELQSHSVDLLAVIPFECFPELIPLQEESEFNYEGYDMAAIEEIVDFLHRRLDAKPGEKRGKITEILSPVLCVLVRMAAKNRLIRKYVKLRVLPPLTKADVLERPEVGDALRNKLCALMTSPAGPVTELVCNFLFVLVKENVQRLIKYTGFGNAAGLLANRGLLGGGKGPTVGSYSSDEDSDTSEYKEVSHLINGFGWIEPEHPPPCEGMTEEQKEVEAMKLVNALDKLNRNQLIQPLQIAGPDGRPQAIEHVCQLLDHSSESLIHSNQHQRSASDSSDSE